MLIAITTQSKSLLWNRSATPWSAVSRDRPRRVSTRTLRNSPAIGSVPSRTMVSTDWARERPAASEPDISWRVSGSAASNFFLRRLRLWPRYIHGPIAPRTMKMSPMTRPPPPIRRPRIETPMKIAVCMSSHSAGRHALPAPFEALGDPDLQAVVALEHRPGGRLGRLERGLLGAARLGHDPGGGGAATGPVGVLLDAFLGGEGSLARHREDQQDQQAHEERREAHPHQPRRRHHRQWSHGHQLAAHRIASIAKSLGSTCTLEYSILSRKLGRRPVARREPSALPSASKPAEWS